MPKPDLKEKRSSSSSSNEATGESISKNRSRRTNAGNRMSRLIELGDTVCLKINFLELFSRHKLV